MENYLLFDTPRRSSRGGTQRRQRAFSPRAASKSSEGSWPATDFMLLEGGASSRYQSEVPRAQAKTSSPEDDFPPARFKRKGHGKKLSRNSLQFFSGWAARAAGLLALIFALPAAVGTHFLVLPRWIKKKIQSSRL
ncbi:MAG: hypothetical protein WCQ50_17990, partial [Spirochaetota bacterium]